MPHLHFESGCEARAVSPFRENGRLRDPAGFPTVSGHVTPCIT